MHYEILIDQKKSSIELQKLASEKEAYIAKILGEAPSEIMLRVEKRGPGELYVYINNRMYRVEQISRNPGSVDFIVNGREVKASISGKDFSQKSRSQQGSDIATVSEIVTSNFPAKVVSVRAKKGSELKEGETIVVLEAMKMEAQVKAPKECKIVEIFVREGDMVSRGSKLAQLKFS